jgi:phosphinothricin acetyltransferase
MDSSTTLRKAQIADLPLIVDILNDVIAEGGLTADISPYTIEEKKNWFAQTSISPLFIQVLIVDDIIAGYVYLSAWRNGRGAVRHVAEISYFLAKRYRGNGYGRFMLKKGIELAEMKGIKSLLAILLDTNARSVDLLKSEGFRIAGHLPDLANVEEGVVGQYIMLRSHFT